jgi:hypothetical protein
MRFAAAIASIAVFCAAPVLAEDAPKKAPSVHIVWMGGNDCPPCRAWRATELPKLEKSAEFQAVRFSYVEKLIGSPVPPSFFMPSEVRPFKDALDEASGGAKGSPQCAILVDGKVYDYFWGTRTAVDFERMLVALRTGKKYPFKRCLKINSNGKCQAYG